MYTSVKELSPSSVLSIGLMESRRRKNGNYVIVFCYYRLKCLINVSLLTVWPLAKSEGTACFIIFWRFFSPCPPSWAACWRSWSNLIMFKIHFHVLFVFRVAPQICVSAAGRRSDLLRPDQDETFWVWEPNSTQRSGEHLYGKGCLSQRKSAWTFRRVQ